MKSMMEGLWLVLLAILFWQVYEPWRYADWTVIVIAAISFFLMLRGEMQND